MYLTIFLNSFQAVVILALCSENAWFAGLGFASVNPWLATICALAGATLGMGLDYGLGYYLSRYRHRWHHFGESNYARAAAYARRYFVWLLLFTFLPGMGLWAVLMGLLRVPSQRVLAAVAVGRLAYYAWFLLSA